MPFQKWRISALVRRPFLIYFLLPLSIICGGMMALSDQTEIALNQGKISNLRFLAAADNTAELCVNESHFMMDPFHPPNNNMHKFKSNSLYSATYTWITDYGSQYLSYVGDLLGLDEEKKAIYLPFWKIPSASELSLLHSYYGPMPSLEEIEKDADTIRPILNRLRYLDFFRKFRVSLDDQCPFWAVENMCKSEDACNICECNEEDIPLPWKMKPIEAFVDRHHANFRYAEATVPVSAAKGTYVDLALNTPSFTGYRGKAVWQQIYTENCLSTTLPSSQDTASCDDSIHFYRMISGMHSNIAALSSEFYYRDISDVPHSQRKHSMAFFREKLADHPDRVANIHFLFFFILRSVCRLSSILQECSCETGNAANDIAARADLLCLLNQTVKSCDETYLFEPLFQDRYEEALSRLNNISRILDCVECEKCRLHGKLKMSALQVAFRTSAWMRAVKILVYISLKSILCCQRNRIVSNSVASSNIDVQALERNEITALINCLVYLSDALSILQRFRERLFWLRFKFVMTLTGIIVTLLVFLSETFRSRLKSVYKQGNCRFSQLISYLFKK